MENATAIFYSDNAFRQRNVGLGLIAHETVHQWFGNAVTPRRWQDLWLSEGFASYWAPLYLGHAQGDSVFRAELREMRETVIAAPVVARRPVVDSVGALTPLDLLNANSYQKGGWVLHMLRTEIGDSAFFASAREYQRIYRHGTATTNNFLQVAERNAGRSLRDFAAQWLHRPGWAELTINATVDPNGRQVALDVIQGTKFAPYAFPLTLLMRDATGKEQRVRVVIAAQQTQRIVINAEGIGKPTSITADPDVMVLATISTRIR
jgi:aminopeptidase N